MAKRKTDDIANIKRKRVVLSIETKVKILKELDEGTPVKNLCATYDVGQSTIYDLKKHKRDILKFYSDADNPKLLKERKTMHQAKNDDVDRVLMEWIKQRRSENFPLNRSIIMTQAKKFHEELDLEKNCDYSHGWFNRFKQRHSLKFLKISGERAAADTESAENYVDYVMEFITKENVTMEQIFNADETALYYKYMPKHTYVSESEKSGPSSGLKESKQRVTLLACANAAGTCKIKLTVIGKSKKPRCLRNIKVLPVNYKANKTAWVTQELFTEWFNLEFVPKARAHCKSVGLASDCKIILFLDNCAAHPAPNLLNKSNVIVQYLPPNCTSLIQPLDQGVLRNLKCKYKAYFLKELLDSCNENKSIHEFLKEFSIKKGIWLAARAWNDVSKDTLTHAWHNLMPSSIFYEEDDESFDGFMISKEKLLQQELQEYAKTSLQQNILREEDIDECFLIDNDVPVTGTLSDSEILLKVLHPDQNNDDSEDDESLDENREEKISNSRCIELTKELIKGMEQKSFVDEFHIMSVYKIQELFLKQKTNMKQMKISDMFKK